MKVYNLKMPKQMVDAIEVMLLDELKKCKECYYLSISEKEKESCKKKEMEYSRYLSVIQIGKLYSED